MRKTVCEEADMPDIQYLLLLQKFREGTDGVFDGFFNAISKIAVDVLVYLPFVVYWAVDKRWGRRFVAVMFGSELVNALLQLTVCAYRPWIRSDLIRPAGDSKVAATGYSFPSGHVNRSTSVLGTTAVWQRRKRGWLSLLCAAGILLVAFSRNYLGVHTPQDVVVGFLVSALAIAAVGKIQDALAGKERLADILTVAGILFVGAAIAYIQLKPYPMDYVDGKLLVDPSVMMNDCFKVCGSFLALLAGLWLDRHFIHYEIPVGHRNLPVLTVVGTGIFFSWKTYLAHPLLVAPLGGHWGNFASHFLGTFFAMALFPLAIRHFTASGRDA
jgi:membrane-associated phospholipid phosphatase